MVMEEIAFSGHSKVCDADIHAFPSTSDAAILLHFLTIQGYQDTGVLSFFFFFSRGQNVHYSRRESILYA